MKKWVGDKIRELAERTLTGWLIKSESPALPAPDNADEAQVSSLQDSGGDAARAVASPEREASPDPQSGAMLKFMSKVRGLLMLVFTMLHCPQQSAFLGGVTNSMKIPADYISYCMGPNLQCISST